MEPFCEWKCDIECIRNGKMLESTKNDVIEWKDIIVESIVSNPSHFIWIFFFCNFVWPIEVTSETKLLFWSDCVYARRRLMYSYTITCKEKKNNFKKLDSIFNQYPLIYIPVSEIHKTKHLHLLIWTNWIYLRTVASTMILNGNRDIDWMVPKLKPYWWLQLWLRW